MAKQIKIGTLNLCLGLPSKKETVIDLLNANFVDVCGLQETEIPMNYPEHILNSGGFTLELELNSEKKRAGIFIRKDISYKRRLDLERENTHLLIIDVKAEVPFRVINVYRSFRPQGLMSADALFKAQLDLIKGALSPNCFVIGDFNLDASMAFRDDYYNKKLLRSLIDFTLENNLDQIVTFDTWSRTINGSIKTSILDHIYTNNNAIVNNLNFETPTFGDHVLVMATLTNKNFKGIEMKIKRNWNLYTPQAVAVAISCGINLMNNQYDNLNVQEQWNQLERVMVETADQMAPLVGQGLTRVVRSCQPMGIIKSKLNKRKRLLKESRLNQSGAHAAEIKLLNKEIRSYFAGKCRSKIRSIVTSGSGNIGLWKAVKVAKNLNSNEYPESMTLEGVPVAGSDLADAFAGHFNTKIKSNVSLARVDPNGVYNGKCQLMVQDRFFMDKANIEECIDMLKNKKCEGFDRIPVCLIKDAKVPLLDPMCQLFKNIYATGQLPEQWKVSKIIPIFKKGCKTKIENYRPIANLCSSSKIFEKLILKQIQYLESKNKLDLTGKRQHGFKKNKSTATAGALLQSIIARAADSDCYVIMASLDLSMAFDMVNKDLLISRLRVMGMPGDVVGLISEWLSGRSFYVDIEGVSSALFTSDQGTIQGSVLGPVLYALFVSPLFDLDDLVNFADDNFCVEWNVCVGALIENLERRLEMITKWLRGSGLVVNESKTEICLFHRNDKPTVMVTLNGTPIKSKKSMNVLGVLFDSKLNWNIHIASAISKARKSLFAIKQLKKYFNENEMRTLLDSYFYSVLYYNSSIWLTPDLNSVMKHDLLAISANGLRACMSLNNLDLSFERLHYLNKKCTPSQIMLYQLSLSLHKRYNEDSWSLNFETVTVIDQMILTSRQVNFQILRNNRRKIGLNTTANKLYHISNLISLERLNLKFVHFKKLSKIQFLKYGKT